MGFQAMELVSNVPKEFIVVPVVCKNRHRLNTADLKTIKRTNRGQLLDQTGNSFHGNWTAECQKNPAIHPRSMMKLNGNEHNEKPMINVTLRIHKELITWRMAPNVVRVQAAIVRRSASRIRRRSRVNRDRTGRTHLSTALETFNVMMIQKAQVSRPFGCYYRGE